MRTRRRPLSSALILGAAALGGCSPGIINAIDLDPRSVYNGLMAHWTFDDGAGSTVLTDSTPNKRDGVVSVGATFQAEDAGHPGFGGFLHFDGSPMSEVDVPAFPQPTGSWSVAGWVHAPDGDTTAEIYDTIISTELPQTGGWQLNLRLSPGPTNASNPISLYQYAYWVGTGVGDYAFQECKCFVANEWVHVAGVADTDQHTISIYHNGAFAGSTTTNTNIRDGSEILYFGRWANDGGRRLIGDLDDFVVYNRAITLPEIKQLASGPLPAKPPTP